MSMPIMSAVVLGMVVAASVPAVPDPCTAAELLPPAVAHVPPSLRRPLLWSLRLSSRKLRLPQGIAVDLRP